MLCLFLSVNCFHWMKWWLFCVVRLIIHPNHRYPPLSCHSLLLLSLLSLHVYMHFRILSHHLLFPLLSYSQCSPCFSFYSPSCLWSLLTLHLFQYVLTFLLPYRQEWCFQHHCHVIIVKLGGWIKTLFLCISFCFFFLFLVYGVNAFELFDHCLGMYIYLYDQFVKFQS